MMKRIVRGGLIAAALAWLLYVTWGSGPFESCEASERKRYAEQVAHLTAPGAQDPLLVRARRRSWCTGVVWYEEREGVLVVAVVLLAIFTWELWTATTGLVGDAKGSAERQLRAYVSVKPEGIAGTIPVDPVVFQVQLMNHGQSPAHHVTISMTRKVMPYPLPDDHVFVDEPAEVPPPRAVLHPHASTRVWSSNVATPISGSDLGAVMNGMRVNGKQLALYCYGTARYTDTFGKRHWTNYCHLYGGRLPYEGVAATKPGDGTTAIYHRHNDTSDDPE
jgi:hypothetical protein